MKKLATIGAMGTMMMLSVTTITSAHADPIGNDTLTISGKACPLVDDSSDGTLGETRCNFPAGFTPLAKGRVSLTEADGSISDILWTHLSHFHYISDPSLTVIEDHEGEFATDLGSVAEKTGNIDVSDKFGFAANSGMVVVTSDATDKSPDPVPEPTTLSLLVVGLAGLGYRLRQRKGVTAQPVP